MLNYLYRFYGAYSFATFKFIAKRLVPYLAFLAFLVNKKNPGRAQFDALGAADAKLFIDDNAVHKVYFFCDFGQIITSEGSLPCFMHMPGYFNAEFLKGALICLPLATLPTPPAKTKAVASQIIATIT
jgi:hypothetical protein